MLIVHIGTQKTGTSTLQTYLSDNRIALLEQGVRYMEAGRDSGRRSSHGHLAQQILKGDYPNVWEDFRSELGDSTSRLNVISAEGFWFCDPASVRKEIPLSAATKIVVYLRRQDQYLQSLWKQAVTGGRKYDFHTWRERLPERGDYLTIIKKWAEHFGRENLIVRPYETDARRGNTVVDFCKIIGAHSLPDQASARRNPSPRLELLHLFRALNHLDLDINRHQFFQAVMEKRAEYTRTCDVLSSREVKMMMAGYASDNRELAKSFYRSDDALLFPDVAEDEDARLLEFDSQEHFQMIIDFLDVLTDFAMRGKVRPPQTDENTSDIDQQSKNTLNNESKRIARRETRRMARKEARAKSP